MPIKEIEAKSILRKRKKVDSWFISHYGMNLYNGCVHNCVYCDGRAEKYGVQGEFGQDIVVKTNALDILRRELDPKRKRIPLKRSYIALGGGVCDGYQPVERTYQLTRGALQLIDEFDFPVHILTKSTLVKRDIDLIKEINQRNRAIVSFSLSSADNAISSVFEPGVPSPEERLKAVSFFKREGVPCGIFLLPVIPFISDTPKILDETVKKARDAGADFIVFGGMTLKEGRQKDHFDRVLANTYPELAPEYHNLYRGDKYGQASGEYCNSIYEMFHVIAKRYGVPGRIPLSLCRDVLDENDLVVVLLEHIDYYLKLEGRSSPYSYAAYSVSKVSEPLSAMKSKLRRLKGVGPTTERIILEILETGKSSYYEKLTKSR